MPKGEPNLNGNRMDPKPFRCLYDPELSQSKSQGTKAIFSKPKTHQRSDDPRRGRTKAFGKRAPPLTALPLPLFALSEVLPPSRRCVLTGVGPLISRSNLRDAVSQFGLIKDCQIVISQTTGASLGIAWVVFEKGHLKAAKKLVESSQQSLVGLGSEIKVQFDAEGTLLESAKKSAEKAAHSLFSASSGDTSRRIEPNEGKIVESKDLKLVELRSLTPTQVTEWYGKFVGIDPNYVLIRDIFLPVKRFSAEDVGRAFKGFRVSHIAVNRSGFYICFTNARDALECYSKMHRFVLFGFQIKLMATIEGKRFRHDEVMHLCHKQAEEDAVKRRTTVSSISKTLRPGQLPYSHAVNEAAEKIMSELSPILKKALWSNVLSPFVTQIIEKELEREEFKVDENELSSEAINEESDSNSQMGESKESTPALTNNDLQLRTSQSVGLGARRGGFVGMTARAVPKYGIVGPWSHIAGMKIRKRESEAPIMGAPRNKQRKPLQITASAPKSYFRAPIEQPTDSASLKTMDSPEEANGLSSSENSDTQMEVEDEEKEDEDEEEDEQEEVTEEETDEELRGMAIDDDSDSSNYTNFDEPEYAKVQKLVRSKDDMRTLCKLLSTVPVPPIKEEELVKIYENDYAPKLRLNTCNWPPPLQTEAFRLSPYRDRGDDERREYLPNLGPGIPNEIVQSYKERPLYEEFEEVEQEESRTSTRALNVSRSAFGLNSDLFADDNLSKNAKDTRLARSAIHDWGLYANEFIPANDFVIEYVGDILRDEYAEIRERHYALEGIDSTYLFRLDNGTVIDATKRGNGARFINHSCDPNCVAQVFDYEGFKRVVLFSLRDIELDEELTFDYNFVKSQDEDGKVRCACGSATCRGWLM